MRTAFGAWLSPVERTVRVREVPSSNLGAPTIFEPPPDTGGGSLSGDAFAVSAATEKGASRRYTPEPLGRRLRGAWESPSVGACHPANSSLYFQESSCQRRSENAQRP